MRKPKGHIRKRPFGYEIAVPEGRNPITKRYSYRYGYAATEEEAETVRDRMLKEVTSGRKPRTEPPSVTFWTRWPRSATWIS